jgi:hypothetical protein
MFVCVYREPERRLVVVILLLHQGYAAHGVQKERHERASAVNNEELN